MALIYSPLLGLKGNLWESKTPNSFSLNPVPHNHNCRKPYENGKGAAWAQSCFSLHLGNPHCTSSLLGPGSSGSQRSRTEKPFSKSQAGPLRCPVWSSSSKAVGARLGSLPASRVSECGTGQASPCLGLTVGPCSAIAVWKSVR